MLETYPINYTPPSQRLSQLLTVAGRTLQKNFDLHAHSNIWYDNFYWIKTQWTFPYFDHLSFAYKNQIFSVLGGVANKIDLQSMRIQRDAAQRYRLIPCIFPVNLQTMQPVYDGWGLIHSRTLQRIFPETMATQEKILLSEWELNDFCIQIVREDLAKQGETILSFCPLPEINPQIWFEDNEGRRSWIIVRLFSAHETISSDAYLSTCEKDPRLKNYDGFFAGVKLVNGLDFGSALYRGQPVSYNYRGLERIHKAE